MKKRRNTGNKRRNTRNKRRNTRKIVSKNSRKRMKKRTIKTKRKNMRGGNREEKIAYLIQVGINPEIINDSLLDKLPNKEELIKLSLADLKAKIPGGHALKINRGNLFWNHQEVLKQLALLGNYENFKKECYRRIIDADIQLFQTPSDGRAQKILNILKPYTRNLKFSDLSVSVAGGRILGAAADPALGNILEYDGVNGGSHIIKFEIMRMENIDSFILEWYKSIRAWNFGLSPAPNFLHIIKDGEFFLLFMSFQKMIPWEKICEKEDYMEKCELRKNEVIERMNMKSTTYPEMKHPDIHEYNIVFDMNPGHLYAYMIDWGPKL